MSASRSASAVDAASSSSSRYQQRSPLLVGHSGARQTGRRAFENGPELQQIHDFVVAHELHGETHRLEEQRRVEAGDEDALAVAHLEYAHHLETANRLADGAARNAQGEREVAFCRAGGRRGPTRRTSTSP